MDRWTSLQSIWERLPYEYQQAVLEYSQNCLEEHTKHKEDIIQQVDGLPGELWMLMAFFEDGHKCVWAFETEERARYYEHQSWKRYGDSLIGTEVDGPFTEDQSLFDPVEE